VSNDSPYSEAWFKRLTFAPVTHERFSSAGDEDTDTRLAAKIHAGLIRFGKTIRMGFEEGNRGSHGNEPVETRVRRPVSRRLANSQTPVR
jgi:hypothetical protein